MSTRRPAAWAAGLLPSPRPRATMRAGRHAAGHQRVPNRGGPLVGQLLGGELAVARTGGDEPVDLQAGARCGADQLEQPGHGGAARRGQLRAVGLEGDRGAGQQLGDRTLQLLLGCGVESRPHAPAGSGGGRAGQRRVDDQLVVQGEPRQRRGHGLRGGVLRRLVGHRAGQRDPVAADPDRGVRSHRAGHRGRRGLDRGRAHPGRQGGARGDRQLVDDGPPAGAGGRPPRPAGCAPPPSRPRRTARCPRPAGRCRRVRPPVGPEPDRPAPRPPAPGAASGTVATRTPVTPCTASTARCSSAGSIPLIAASRPLSTSPAPGNPAAASASPPARVSWSSICGRGHSWVSPASTVGTSTAAPISGSHAGRWDRSAVRSATGPSQSGVRAVRGGRSARAEWVDAPPTHQRNGGQPSGDGRAGVPVHSAHCA